MDIIFIIAMCVVIEHALKKHHGRQPNNGADIIALVIISAFFLAIFRLPIYWVLYGWKFPFHPSNNAEIFTGIGAIAFWWSMIWWQIPGRMWRAIFRAKP